jgi:drug/metabolite transporter (DMT)-like permease
LLFAAMGLIWGVPYLLIRVAVRDMSPPTVVMFRTGISAVVLLPFVRPSSIRPLLSRWQPLLAYTVVEVTAPWWLLTTAEQHISSALAGILLAAVPVVGVVLARMTSGERVDRMRVAGLVMGVIGVVGLVGLDVGDLDLLAVGAVLLTAVGYAVGPVVLTRRLADLPPVDVVAASMVITAAVWAAPAALSWPTHVSAKPALSVAALALVCTVVAFLLFFRLIAEVGPARATVITYVNPAVAVLLGVTLLDEPLTRGMAIGFPLVLAGSVLATSSRRMTPGRGERASSAPPPDVDELSSVNG